MYHLINFQTAILAHEAGFKNEKSLLWYDDNGSKHLSKAKFPTGSQDELRDWLLAKGINVMTSFYESGTYSFKIYTHNGDNTGWQKNGFMNPSFYTIKEAFEEGLQQGIKIFINTKKLTNDL